MKINKKGFTLIELMVVMAIIAVLATLIIGAVQLARSTATETAQRSNAKTIQTALEGAYAKNRAYCGYTGGLACNTPISLKSAATTLGITLSTGINNSAGTGCAAGGNEEGGGRIVTLTSSSYAIFTADSACAKWTTFDDVLQVGMAAPYKAGGGPGYTTWTDTTSW